MTLVSLHRTLDQELVALLRGASLECLCCGEFVMHARGGAVFCPECGAQLAGESARVSGASEVPDTFSTGGLGA
jgi:predicted RNA-binding Zn-ribbon protein involved in translation (DUF1610 family)